VTVIGDVMFHRAVNLSRFGSLGLQHRSTSADTLFYKLSDRNPTTVEINSVALKIQHFSERFSFLRLEKKGSDWTGPRSPDEKGQAGQ